jgi:hypothetical protein
MLIGVLRGVLREETEFSPIEYQPQVLQCNALLVKTNTQPTLETVVQELRTFRQVWHRNEELIAPFDICQWTGMCPDVLFEISEYLSLNDTINAFSISILPLLRNKHFHVHLSNPSDRFLELIPRYVNPRQIASLHITEKLWQTGRYFSNLRTLDQLISLTMLIPGWTFPDDVRLLKLLNIRNLSVCSEEEVGLHVVRDLQILASRSAARIHIRCAGLYHDATFNIMSTRNLTKNTTTTSYVFDLEYKPAQQNQPNRLLYRYRVPSENVKYLLTLIQSLVSIQRIRFITNRSYIEHYLKVHLWRDVVEKCVRLDRVILQLVDDGDFTQQAHNIEQELRRIRPEMIFRMKSA